MVQMVNNNNIIYVANEKKKKLTFKCNLYTTTKRQTEMEKTKTV